VVAEVIVAVIAVVIVFEVFEHVIIPLIGTRASRGRQTLTGPEAMVGKVVEIRRWSGCEGIVFVDGEFWQATSCTPLSAGAEATIVAVSNLTLHIEPLARSIASDEQGWQVR